MAYFIYITNHTIKTQQNFMAWESWNVQRPALDDLDVSRRQELKDVGVAVEALDKEGLVQAMVQQLSWRGVGFSRRGAVETGNRNMNVLRLEYW